MKAGNISKTKSSRSGKHRLDKSLVGFFADDDFRALLALVVDKSGETATEIMMDGVRRRATALGILKNGEIAKEYQSAFELVKAVFSQTRKNKENKK